MNYPFLSLFALILLANSLWGQTPDLQNMQVDVVYLASDLLEGRAAGTKGEALAADYIARRFDDLGLEPVRDDSWFQSFTFSYKTNPHAAETKQSKGKNVLGWINHKAKKTVVIGAHYDHLGYGEYGSRYTGEPAIHNGADDNASGVAVLLSLAEILREKDFKHHNYLFIAFSAEELGLHGSKYFTKDPGFDLEDVDYMLNFDMVGRLDSVLIVNGVGTSPIWKESLEAVKPANISYAMTESGIGPSDHTSFYLEDIPSVHFFSGQHDDYHKPADDSELLNYEGMALIAEVAVDLIREIGKVSPAFTKTKDEQEGRRAARFKVSLGVMPDYAFQGTGMRIDGVLQGRAAEKAGMEDGDVIVKIGDLEIKDIYGYMEGLAQYEAGDTTTIVVKRKDKEVALQVTF
jgi:hypothetical protein